MIKCIVTVLAVLIFINSDVIRSASLPNGRANIFTAFKRFLDDGQQPKSRPFDTTTARRRIQTTPIATPIAPPLPPTSNAFSSEQYLAMAASMDSDFCLPVAICSAMARSSAPAHRRSKFDDLVVRTFEMKLNGHNGYPAVSGAGSQSPMNIYVDTARFGRHVGDPEACRQVSPTCKFTVEELRQLTLAVF